MLERAVRAVYNNPLPEWRPVIDYLINEWSGRTFVGRSRLTYLAQPASTAYQLPPSLTFPIALGPVLQTE